MAFTHLQVRSGYSFYESTVQIEPLVKRAQEHGFTALALTDDEVLHGAIQFYQACEQAGIKPLIGLHLTVEVVDKKIAVILFAKDEQGYQELIRISTTLQIEKNRAFDALFNKPTDHLICIIKAVSEPLHEALLTQNSAQVKEIVEQFAQKISAADIYVGITNIRGTNRQLLEQASVISKSENIPFVALHDVRYITEKDVYSYDCLQAMKVGRTWQQDRVDADSYGRYLCAANEIAAYFRGFESMLEATEEIAQKCNVTITFHKNLLPQFPTPNGQSAHVLLRQRCEAALHNKYSPVTKEIEERLAYELAIIDRLHFNDYFLIVADFVQFAKDNGIVVGPGRGSAAGSLVAYLLGITDIDPLEHHLLFERFLNPERITMPDIDIDFSDRRRDEVIAYVRDKYGKDYVAQIITFGTFGARSILRELMKTMNVDASDQQYILKRIPAQTNKPLTESIAADQELANYIKQSNKLSTLITIALKLEGLPRHSSLHAAGIVIGKRPLIQDVPLMEGSHGTYVTQYAMEELETIGLLKMDILGLRNLTLIEQIVQSIQTKEDPTFSLATIPHDDQKTFALMQQGKTNGIFQFESEGMKRVLQQLKPTAQNDLIALNALYRPGPMEHIPTYIRRKHRLEKVTYLHPDLKPILEETYGVLVYQEQIMQIAHRFAGLSLGEADLLRRAISKKNMETMDKLKDTFINGCVRNNYPQKVAEQLFQWIVQFANYGFNKSHSVAYSKIAYQLAYLKANYPHHFFTQLLSSVIHDSGSKRTMYIREANELGIQLLPPSINHSYAYYTTENNAIRIGFLAIKGIGYETVKTIIEARKEGHFTDLYDFCLRVSIKRNAIETLILAGAFDELYPNRASLLATLTPALERKELFGKQLAGSLFDTTEEKNVSYIEVEDFSLLQKLNDEKELLQIYVSTHPLKEHRKLLTLRNMKSIAAVKKFPANREVNMVAFIQRMKKIYTKRGDSMAFVTLSDETDEIDAVIFPNLFREVNPFIEEDTLIKLSGKTSLRNDEQQIIIDHLEPFKLEELQQQKQPLIYIRVTPERQQTALVTLQQIAQHFPGDTRIIVYDEAAQKTYRLSERYVISNSTACLNALKNKFGNENVVFK